VRHGGPDTNRAARNQHPHIKAPDIRLKGSGDRLILAGELLGVSETRPRRRRSGGFYIPASPSND